MGLVCFSPSAKADSDMPQDSTLWLDDVTVTAIKQQSDLSLQPVASTVLTAGQARRWNVEGLRGMSEIAPNFYMPNYGSRMTSSIYVRGIGARMDQPAVGLNVDNVPILNKDNYDFDLVDIDRVEMLRGPQSTLYGRNTMTGLINIYTLNPMTFQGSKVAATIGNGPYGKLAVSHYRKFSPSLAMSFSGNFNFFDGFYRNHYNAAKVDTEKGGSLRWKTQWRPSERISVDNTASFSLYRQSGYPYEYVGSGVVNYNDTCFYRRNSLLDGLTVKWTGTDVTVSSITSLQYVDDNMTLDQDFLPVKYFTITQARHEWALTEDIVARGVKCGYSWMAGLFGFYKNTSMHAPVTLKEDGIARLLTDRVNLNPNLPIRLEWADPTIPLGSNFHIPVWGLALYHQSSYDVGRWNFTLGLRLDYEHTALSYNSVCNTSCDVYMRNSPMPNPIKRITANIDERGRLSDSYLELLPKLTVTYDLGLPSKSSLYASVAKGYKSGGYNTQMFSEVLQQRLMADMMSSMPGGASSTATPDIDAIVSYKPEMSWNYELGAHIACDDNRVMTDISLYYIDVHNQQLTMFPDESTTGRITANAGRTRSFGAELQIRYAPTNRWIFNVSYGYTNAKFIHFSDGKVNYKGKYVPYAPINTLFGSAEYHHPIGHDWSMAYEINCRAVGNIYWNEDNSMHQPFYALPGLTVTARCDWFSLQAWLENVSDTHYNVFYFQSMGNSFVQRGNPRRFGITARLNF